MTNTLKISSTGTGNMSTVVSDYSPTLMDTDGVTGQKELEYINSDWKKQWGFFNTNPDFKSAIISKATWNVGKGWTADPRTTLILQNITGNGKDTFDEILFNMEVIKRVAGDAFAEIIWENAEECTGIILNLKPLNPGTIKQVFDENGIRIRYEQITNLPDGKQEVIKFKPQQIFHLSHNRFADSLHGMSDTVANEEAMLAEMENSADLRKLMHRQARPLIMFKLGTDDTTTINAFVAKMDAAVNKGENIYIPDDANSVNYDVVDAPISSSIFEWRNDLRKKFYRTIELPELLPSGGGDATESGGKIGYLSFEQVVEKCQRQLEQQIWAQLSLKINLIPPATLSESLKQDEQKDPNVFQANDIEAGVGK